MKRNNLELNRLDPKQAPSMDSIELNHLNPKQAPSMDV